MASKGSWTVVFEDKVIIKNNGSESGTGYNINDDSFWSQSKFSNIWAIQYGTSTTSDEVEYRDETPHSAYDSSVLGAFSEFTSRWDSAHLTNLQDEWDNDNAQVEDPADSGTYRDETSDEKIARLGARPTSYSS